VLDEALPEISADPDLLHRALQNLVLNAIDAMPQGGSWRFAPRLWAIELNSRSPIPVRV